MVTNRKSGFQLDGIATNRKSGFQLDESRIRGAKPTTCVIPDDAIIDVLSLFYMCFCLVYNIASCDMPIVFGLVNRFNMRTIL